MKMEQERKRKKRKKYRLERGIHMEDKDRRSRVQQRPGHWDLLHMAEGAREAGPVDPYELGGEAGEEQSGTCERSVCRGIAIVGL